MNLIILTEADREDDGLYRLTDHRADHIREVLRSEPGDSVEIGLLNGPVGSGLMETVTEAEVVIRIAQLRDVTPSPPEIDIICALPRPQILKRVLLTAAMMAVRRLFLIRANRVEKSYFQSPLLAPERYEPHLLDGLSQGKLTRVPIVSVHERFRPFMEETLPAALSGGRIRCIKLLPDWEAADGIVGVIRTEKLENLIVAIGPEGGWVPFELEMMEKQGFQRFTLGRSVLRVDTALAVVLGQIELVAKARTGLFGS